uniref:6-phosphogluconolactonase n=1 Tax=Acrobeloides nanus TaxID=290746 RepID=A0A914DM34_9BILA
MLSPEQGDKLRLFVVDERLVPLDDPESNTGVFLRDLPAIFEERFVLLKDPTNASASREEFVGIFKSWNPPLSSDGFPIFDVLFLGMGPDGHTCSLFPGHSLLQENKEWVAIIEDSPKPPPRRVTITLPVINNAKNVAFIATGESKAQILKEIIDEKTEKYPSGLVKPKSGSLYWFLDISSARLLKDHTKSEL